MPFGDPDPSDPQVLVAVSLPASRAEVRAMAAAFAEEFARLGLRHEEVVALFRNSFYTAPHQALALLGEEEIARLVNEAIAAWGGFRVVTVESEAEAAHHTQPRLVDRRGRLKLLP